MGTQLRQWVTYTPPGDIVQQQQASLVRWLLLSLAAFSFVGTAIPLLAPIPRADALVVMAITLIGVPTGFLGIVLLRRGRMRAAVLLASAGIALMLSLILVTTGIRGSGSTILGFALPIVIAGLLAGRRELGLTIGACGLGVATTMLLEQTQLPLVGIAAPRGDNAGGVLGGFVAIASSLGLLTARFGQVLRTALREAQERAGNLQEMQQGLAAQVAERTAHLQSALAEVEARSAEQAALLNEVAQQREVIRELSVPVLPISSATLVLPLVGALDSGRLQALQERALQAAARPATRRLVLDVSGVPVIDAEVAHGLLSVVSATRLLGAEALIVGIRPEVAQTLVSLGHSLGAVRTFADLEAAIHDGR